MADSATAAERLAKMLKSGTMVVAPGVYDCVTGRLVEQAGFDAAYMTGAGTSAAHGYPDFGLITMSEMVDNARRIAKTIGIPLVSDIDTGYGNELNVYRTIQEFEAAGVAAVHLEDQGFPKKCGHLDDKEIVPLEDYLAKIRAAAAARKSRHFTLIARTDSRARLGFDEAIRRGNAALEAGADVVFVEAPQSMAEIEQIPKRIKGPCLYNAVQGGKSPAIDMPTAAKAGFAITIVPGVLMRNVVAVCDEVLARLKNEGSVTVAGKGTTVQQNFARFGSVEWDERRTAFRTAKQEAAE